MPATERRLFVAGELGSGNGGHNRTWNWHIRGAKVAETATALCDGRPSLVQAHLSDWLHTVKRFCPWTSSIHAEVQ